MSTRLRSLGTILLGALLSACQAAGATRDGSAASSALARPPAEPLGTPEARWYFPGRAVDGRCMYAAPFPPGGDVEEYLRTSISGFLSDLPPDPGVFPIDLDCFASLSLEELDWLEARDGAAAAYVANGIRWLRDPEALEVLTLREAAARLRSPEAQRRELGDPFYVLARKAERRGSLRCAEQLMSTSATLGLTVAHFEWDRLWSGLGAMVRQGIAVPEHCSERLEN